MTVGPNFRLLGSVNMDVSLSGSFKAAVTLADWDTQVSFPDPGTSGEFDPQDLQTPEDKTQPGDASFDWSVQAEGQITAHLKPQASFSITWGSVFSSLDNCEVDLVLDGYMQAYVRAGVSGGSSTDTSASVCYRANMGAELYVKLDAPDQFNWLLEQSPWSLNKWGPVSVSNETCPISSSKRTVHPGGGSDLALQWSRKKRDSAVIGPLLHFSFGLSCPDQSGNATGEIPSCPLCTESTVSKRWLEIGSNDTELTIDSLFARDNDADGGSCVYYPFAETACPASGVSARGVPEKRDKKIWTYTDSSGTSWDFTSSAYPNCGKAVSDAGIGKWYGYDASQQQPACVPSTFKKNDGTETYFCPERLRDRARLRMADVRAVRRMVARRHRAPSAGRIHDAQPGVGRTGHHGRARGQRLAHEHGAPRRRHGRLVELPRLLHPRARRGQQRAVARARRRQDEPAEGDLRDEKPGRGQGGCCDHYDLRQECGRCLHVPRLRPTDDQHGGRGYLKQVHAQLQLDRPRQRRLPDALPRPACRGRRRHPGHQRRARLRGPHNPGAERRQHALAVEDVYRSVAGTIEANAKSYCTAASQYFVATAANPSPKYLITTGNMVNGAWATSAFGAGGWCVAPKLPRPQGGGGLYGAYAYPAYTVDAKGATVNLGNPEP